MSWGTLWAVVIATLIIWFANVVHSDIKDKRAVESLRQQFVLNCVEESKVPTSDIETYNQQVDGCTEAAAKLHPYTGRMNHVY